MSTYEPQTQDSTEPIDAGDEGVILGSPDWVGPLEEFDKYGKPTGATYVRCPECGIEVLTGATDHASHRPECPHYEE